MAYAHHVKTWRHPQNRKYIYVMSCRQLSEEYRATAVVFEICDGDTWQVAAIVACLVFSSRTTRPADGEWRESAGGADVTDDVDCDADDAMWLDAALVAAASDAEVAGVAPPRAPRVGAQLDSHAYTDSDLIAFHVYASWFSPPSCG